MRTFKESGFGLIEVLIAVALLGAVSLGVMQVSKTMSTSSIKHNLDNDVLTITKEIVSILSVPANCMATFGGKNGASATATSISQNGMLKFPVNTTYGNAHFTISSYALSVADSDVSLATNTSKLLVNFKRLKVSSGQTDIVKKIRLFVEVDAAQNITNCRALSSGGLEIWQRGAGSDIYYQAGNVAIGHQTPTAKLDVDGEVKFGNSSSICDAATEGQQRYNSSVKNMEFCDGTSWRAPGGTVKTRNCVTFNVSTAGATCPAGKIVTQIYTNGGDWGGGGDNFTCCETYVE